LSIAPITAFAFLWCNLDPELLVALELVTLGTIVFAAAVSLGTSLWTKGTGTALLWTYGLLGAWLLSWNIGGWPFGSRGQPAWLLRINPYFLLIDRWTSRRTSSLDDAWFFLLFTGTACVALLVLAIATLGRVAVAGERRAPRRRWVLRLLPVSRLETVLRRTGPSLDGNPVLWRDWRRAGNSSWSRAFWIVYFGVTLFGTLACTHSFWNGQVGHPDLVVILTWLLLASSLAWYLLRRTVRSFDRWMGRMPGQGPAG